MKKSKKKNEYGKFPDDPRTGRYDCQQCQLRVTVSDLNRPACPHCLRKFTPASTRESANPMTYGGRR
jgi:hypothetical protein